MAERSAGVLMYRTDNGELQVFIVHPGGPHNVGKDEGIWSIPKGLIKDDESLFETAFREFQEETGIEVGNANKASYLGVVRQKSGKYVHAWTFEGDTEPDWKLESNSFWMEWPKGSLTWQRFPEVDRGGFFSLDEARRKLNPAQAQFLDMLMKRLP